MREMGWSWRRLLILSFLLALGLRLLIGARTQVIAQDAAVYLDLAQRFQAGDFKGWLGLWEPLYPLLAALAGSLVGNLEWGGKLVSALFGALTVFPLYLLARRLFGERVGFLAILFYIFHPRLMHLSGDALTDATYIFFITMTLWQGLEAIAEGRRANFLCAGLLTAASYLVRPEGMGVILVVGLWTVGYLGLKMRRSPLFCLERLFLLGLIFLLLALPYILYLKSDTGQWMLTRRYALFTLFGKMAGSRPPVFQGEVEKPRFPALSRLLPGLRFMALSFVEMVHPLLLILLIFGLIMGWRRRPFPPWGWYLFSVIIMYLGLFYLMFLAEGRRFVNERYILFYVPLLLPWVGEGFERLWQMASSRRGKIVLAVLLLLILGGLSGPAMRERRGDKLFIVELGRWMGGQVEGRPRLMSTDFRFAYYAGGRDLNLLSLGRASPEAIIKYALEMKVDYIVLQVDRDRMLLGYDLSPHLAEAGFQLARVAYDNKGKRINIFRRVSSSGCS